VRICTTTSPNLNVGFVDFAGTDWACAARAEFADLANESRQPKVPAYLAKDPASWDGTRTPLPDDVSNPGGGIIVTRDVLNALQARKNRAGEPTADDEQGSGAKINTGVNGTGGEGSLSQPLPDSVAYKRIAITGRDLAALEVRLTSKIHTIR
jgi:hypothetical protein